MLFVFWLGCVAVGLTACAVSAPALKKVDLEDPGWRIWRGQALWKPNAERPTLAGEIIAARHLNGDVLVNFSKSPLPLVTAQTAGDTWRFDIVEGGRFYSGSGSPPKRIVWFFLPALLDGETMPKNWKAGMTEKGVWTVRNQRTGETIRMVIE